jgi:putative DNA primase/helicase
MLSDTEDMIADAVERAEEEKPDLIVLGHDLPATAREVRDTLADSGLLFDRGKPVKLIWPADGGPPTALPLAPNNVVIELHALRQPVCYDDRGQRRQITLSHRVATMYLDMGHWKLRPLTGVTTAPLIAKDGSILTWEGYHPATGLWCAKVPPLEVPVRPTLEEAEAALLKLRKAFRTFPFADSARKFGDELCLDLIDLSQPPGRSESAFLSGLMTAVCRPSLWLAPGLLIIAPAVSGAGSGKGLLARAICSIAFGIRPHAFTAGGDRTEMDKRLAGELVRQLRGMVHIGTRSTPDAGVLRPG